MNFIKKIADKKVDALVHLQFQKFSKGEFTNRAIIKVKKSGSKYTISTTAEFANDLVRDVAEKLDTTKTEVKGGIISTVNLKEIPKYKDILAHAKVKQFQGVKNYQISTELSGKEIVEMVDAFPKAFFGLSFESENTKLKIKPKAPKSGKPSSKGEETPNPDFCRIVTTDTELGKSFIFEKDNFKDALVNHTFIIEKIEIPEELKKSEDFAKIREGSLRVGKILRKSVIDGIESVKEVELRV